MATGKMEKDCQKSPCKTSKEVVRHLEETLDLSMIAIPSASVCVTTLRSIKETSTLEQTIVTFLVSFRIWIPFC